MKISNTLLFFIAASSASTSVASVENKLIVQNVEKALLPNNLRGLKKVGDGDANATDAAAVEEPAEETAEVPAEEPAEQPAEETEADADESSKKEKKEKKEKAPEEAVEGEDEAGEEGEEEAAPEPDVADEPVPDEPGSISPAVWYSIGGAVVLIGGYFACCKKSDEGYSRIQ